MANNPTQRPFPVLIIGWLFIGVGIFGFAYHATEINLSHPFEIDVVLALFVRLLAVLGGAYLLRGAAWARQLLTAWLVYHIVLSSFHSASQAAMHALLLVVIASFLFLRRNVAAYFTRPAQTPTEQ